MTTMVQPDRIEAYFVAELKAKSTQELRQFLFGAWMASILSAEAIEELYHELQRKEAAEPEETEEDAVEMGQD
jgi:cytochrome c553